MPAWGELFGKRSKADRNRVSGRLSSSEVSLARDLRASFLGSYQGLEYFRLLHDQIVRTEAGLINLVQSLVQLRPPKAPISPLGSSLLH